jgi:DNA (cytosine-5)-methyltransferase 1
MSVLLLDPLTSAQGSGAKPLSAISLFSGVGGIELGLGAVNAATVTAFCEAWEPAAAVLRHRFPGVRVHDDVRTVTSFAGAELVTAGFPCTDLSPAGRTLGMSGTQSSLVLGVLDVIRSEQPSWVLLENVPNLLHLGQGHAMEAVIDHLEGSGYRWAYRIVDSRFTGLAQRRRRVLILAARDRDPAPLLLGEDAGAPDVPHAARAFGFSWTEGNRGLGWGDSVVPTLRGGTTVSVASPPGIWRPDAAIGQQIVRPSIEAAELLQGFPAGWTSAASPRDRWKLVGNAVSTRVAAWVGERLMLRDEGLQSPLGVPLAAGARWPKAAHGGPEGRCSVGVSEFPRVPDPMEQQNLAGLLDLAGSEPLSLRATRGFRDRLQRSRLLYQPAFMNALNVHVEVMAEREQSSR